MVRSLLFVAAAFAVFFVGTVPVSAQYRNGNDGVYRPPRPPQPNYNAAAYAAQMRAIQAQNQARATQQMMINLNRAMSQPSRWPQPQPQRQQPTQQYRRPQQQTRSQPQRVYRSTPSTSRPVTSNSVVRTTTAVPKNTIPEQTSLSLTSNSMPMDGFSNLPQSRVDPITGELAGALKQEFDTTEAAFKQATDDAIDSALDVFGTVHATTPQAQAELDQVRQELMAGNYANAKAIAAAANHIPGGARGALIQTIEQFNERSDLFGDFKQGLRDGYNAAQLQPFIDRLRTHMNYSSTAVFNPATQSTLNAVEGLQKIQQNLAIEESLYAGPPATMPSWSLMSPQPLQVIYDPSTPAGTYYVGGSNLIVAPSANGKFSTGRAPFAEAMRLPIGVSEPAAEPTESDKKTGSRFVINNPDESAPTINFQLSNTNYSLKPGETKTISSSSSRIIRFDSGDGTSKYTMAPGTYNFRLKDGAWKFYRAKSKVQIENGNSTAEFSLVVDGKKKTIGPSESIIIEGDYPPVVRFDPGNGSDSQERVLTGKAYTVAIDSDAECWDLFEDVKIAGDVPLESTIAQSGSSPKRKPRW